MKADNHKHWANVDETGSVWGLTLMIHVYRFGGKPLFTLLMAPVMLFYFLSKPEQRHVSKAYLERLHKFSPETMSRPNLWMSFKHFWCFGESLIDKFAVWMGRLSLDSFHIHGDELISDLQDAGKGAVIFVSHLGNFEICQCLSTRHEGMKLTVLHNTKNAQKFNQVLEKFNGQSHIDLMQIAGFDISMGMSMSEKISKGHFIAIAGDRLSVDNPEQSFDIPFLGETASFPQGPFVLANALACEALFVCCIKRGRQYHIYIDRLKAEGVSSRKDRQTATRAVAKKYVSYLEKYTLIAPLQWYNFFPFWQSDNRHDPK